MGNINRVAKGLLSLLDSQTQGSTPDDLSKTTVPTIAQETFLVAARGITVETVTFAGVNAPGFSSTLFLVPAGEMWLLLSASLIAYASVNSAGKTFRGNIFIHRGSGAGSMFQYITQTDNADAVALISESSVCSINFPMPGFPIQSGDGIGFDVAELKLPAVFGVDGEMTISYCKLTA